MTREDLIVFWKKFFKDLFVNTLLRFAGLTLTGIGVGAVLLLILKSQMIEPAEWSGWIQWIVTAVAGLWLCAWGGLHGFAGAATLSLERKISEAIVGLQGLLDLLSRQIFAAVSKTHKTYTKNEIAEKFDSLGHNFKNELRLKGPAGWFASIVFELILKGLRLLFLDQVAETLMAKPGDEITATDIESAIRRAGVSTLLAPVADQFILIHFLNFALMLISLGMPFALFFIF